MKKRLLSLLMVMLAVLIPTQLWAQSTGQSEWIEQLTNGDAESPWTNPDTRFDDQENNYKICAWSKEKGVNMNSDSGWDPFPATIEEEEGNTSNHVFVVHGKDADTEGDASAWDNQFWIQSPRAWSAGTKIRIKFRYKASKEVTTNTQVHLQTPSVYLHWMGIGDIKFTTDWQEFNDVMTINDSMDGCWSLAFNLNYDEKTATDFYFDDLSWSVYQEEQDSISGPEPYAVLSEDNTVLTFYYDGLKDVRNGMGLDLVEKPGFGGLYTVWVAEGYDSMITKAVVDSSFSGYSELTSTANWFQSLRKLDSISGLEYLNTDNVTDMQSMFSGCSALTSLDVSNFNTANVTDMGSMFFGCSGLTSLDLSGFKTDNVTNMGWMFYDCSRLRTLNISGFKTDNVTNMSYMFCNCSRLTGLDLSNFNTLNVTSMAYMFNDCSLLKSLNLGGFNTSNVTNMSSMFESCSILEKIYVGSGWNTTNVTNVSQMFYLCKKLIGGKETTYNKWVHSSSAIQKDYAHIDGGVNNPGLLTDIADFGTIQKRPYAVLDGTTLTFYYDENMNSSGGMVVAPFGGTGGNYYSDWYSNKNIKTVVFDASFAKCTSIVGTSLWFYEGNGITSVIGLEYLKTDNAKAMDYMFSGCSSLTGLDLSSFNTSNVTDMQSMFSSCSSMTSLDLSNFNTKNVTKMEYMFQFCSNLTTIYVGNDWSVESVTAGNNMFRGCTNLIGGNGTTFDANHIDHTYAHIDGGPDNPGYFTAKGSSYNPFIYFIGSTDGWAQSDQRLALSGEGGIYTGFVYCADPNGWGNEFKFQRVAGDWNSQLNAGSFTGGCTGAVDNSYGDDGNIKITEGEGVYYMTLNLGESTLNAVKVNKMGIIGDFNGWNGDVEMTWNPTNYCYEATNTGITALGWKFRINSNWEINLGGTIDNLVQNGANLLVVGDTIKLYPTRKTSNYVYCTLDGNSDPVTTRSPYAVLSSDSLTVTFFYDDQKTARGGIDINNGSLNWPYSIVTTAVFDASFADYRPISTEYWFYDCSSLTSILGIENLKTDNVTNMSRMFASCNSLTTIDVSGFKTDHTTEMGGMFEGCSSLTTIDVSGFNTENVTGMGWMFAGCSSLTTIDVSGFKTDNVTSMEYMFAGCSSLTNIDVRGFKTDNVAYIRKMFEDCSGMTSIDISGFKTDNVMLMESMFDGCSNLTTIYVGKGWSTAKVEDGNNMFNNCTKLVGGAGTTYDANHVDHTYAHIDGGADNPGYFTSLWSDRKLVQWRQVGGKEYRLYKANNKTDVRTNADGWNMYRTRLTLDIISGTDTTTTVVDDGSIYCEQNLFNNAMTQCMMIDVENNKMYVFANSKTDGRDYSMDGFVYISSVDQPSFTKETVFTDANWGWFSYFRGVEDGQPLLSHFSYLGYYDELSKRNADGTWSTETEDSPIAAPNYRENKWIETRKFTVVGDTSSDEVTLDGVTYTVRNGNNAWLTWMDNCTYVESLTIPETLTADGRTLTVNGLAPLSCYTLTRLQYLEMPSTMDMLGESVLIRCGNLKLLTVNRKDPPTLIPDNGALRQFTDIDSVNCVLRVPYGSKALYESAEGWRKFQNIVEMDAPIAEPEPYAVLEENTNANGMVDAAPNRAETAKTYTLKFYYDTKKTERNGMSVGPFSSDTSWDEQRESITSVVFDASFADCTTLTSTAFWFYGFKNLTSITGISNLKTDNVTDMNSMFCDCSSLTSLDLTGFKTDRVKYMDEMFAYCSGLTTIYAGDGWTTASVTQGKRLFEGCTSLVGGKGTAYDSLYVDYNYAHIDGGPSNPGYFTDIADTAVVIDDIIQFADANVKAICVKSWDTNSDGELSKSEAATVSSLNGVFTNNRGITSFDEFQYFTGVTEIGSGEFMYCESLTSIILPTTVQVIEQNAFFCCNIENFRIPASVTTINDGLYASSKYFEVDADNAHFCSVDGVVFTKDMTTLVVYPNKEGESYTIPETVVTIGSTAFYTNPYLKSVVIPDGLKTIGRSAFRYCKLFESVNIPEGVESIGGDSFEGTALTSFTFPKTVTYIGEGVLSDCDMLTEIIVDPENENYCSIDGALYTKDGTVIMVYPAGKPVASVTVPEHVRDIATCAFYGNDIIESVTINKEVESIGWFAFIGCPKLMTVTMLKSNPIQTSTIFDNDFMESGTLYVPAGCAEAYRSTSTWNQIKNIVEMEPEVDYTFDYNGVLTVGGSTTLANALSAAGGRDEVAKTITAIVWNSTATLTNSDLNGLSNPNMLIYVKDASQAPDRDNVIIDGVAKNIMLSDVAEGNNNFYCPQAFTAEMISYTRNFQQQTEIGVCRGWETIALPFTVQTIMHEKNGVISPFGNDASTKHFWLRQLIPDESLAQATVIEANTPYLISMPNSNEYPAEFNQAGRVTFSSQNAVVPVTSGNAASMRDSATNTMIVFYPTMQRIAQNEELYALNVGDSQAGYAEGSVFVAGLRDIRPFECYTWHHAHGPAPQFIPINELNGGATGIEDVGSLMSDGRGEGAWYDLNGRKLQQKPTRKGVYILNGQKVVIK